MKIRLFTIPNMLTLGNLLCGTAATIALLTTGDFTLAFWLMVISAIFDFFDGFAARLLHSTSAIGVQLDSLADMVSFGLVPSVALWTLFEQAPQLTPMSEQVANIVQYATLFIVAFSALRLAKFNIDDTQHTEFCGLPTPANGLFCLSLAMLASAGEFTLYHEVIASIAIIMALLLVSPIRMFALKFKGFGWKANILRYSFILFSAVMVVLFTRYAVPTIIVAYILISTIRHAINLRK